MQCIPGRAAGKGLGAFSVLSWVTVQERSPKADMHLFKSKATVAWDSWGTRDHSEHLTSLVPSGCLQPGRNP